MSNGDKLKLTWLMWNHLPDLPKGQEWKVAHQDLGTAIRSRLTVTYPDTADFNGKETIYRLHYKRDADEV